MNCSRWIISSCLVLVLLTLTACAPPSSPVPAEITDRTPCGDLTFKGFPRLEPADRRTFFVCHEGFALNYHPRLRNALWVVQRLSAANLDDRTASRDREEFRADGFMPKGMTPDPERWSNTGYDRGHLAPADDFIENQVGMSHSFYTSNIVPQDPSHNRGIWRALEQNTRRWALEKGELYVVTGPVFEDFRPLGWLGVGDEGNYVISEQDLIQQNREKKRIEEARKRGEEVKRLPPPINGIAIPTHLYKIIYDPAHQTAIAFVVPNVPGLQSEQLPQFATSVAEVERVTRIRFFPELTFEEQAILKTQVNASQWVLKLEDH